MHKSCLNCVKEYRCDWTPAKGKDCCDEWITDGTEKEDISYEGDQTILQ